MQLRNSPLFSIVMANYNGGRFIEESILSVLNQSCQDFELIIVDGGSTDNSVEIIKKYENHIAWWVSEKDRGQSDAFNKGFAKAKGEFYFWVNTDDLLLSNSLKYAKNVIRKNSSYKWFAANTIFFDEKGKITKCSRGPSWKEFLFKKAPLTVYGPTSIFHKSIFEKVGGFDENLNYTMDTDLWMRFRNLNLKFKRIRKYFWGFRIHNESKTSHAFSNKPNEHFYNEQNWIAEKNDQQYKKSGYFIQSLYKFFTGIYFQSWLDTICLKGRNINKSHEKNC